MHDDSSMLCSQVIRTPPTPYFIKKAAGVEVGSHEPGHQRRGTISLKHVFEIAKARYAPMTRQGLPALMQRNEDRLAAENGLTHAVG